jgi:opacity protein-like surface antigen
MKRSLGTMALALLIATTAAAASVERTYNAPVDRVWAATEAVLKHLGWDVDKSDRDIGFITTDSRRVDGENYGVYEKALRHRLQLHVKRVGDNRTTVSVERTLFKRERILFVDNDEPVTAPDQNVEKALLDAIGKAL